MNLVAKEYVAAQDPEDPGVLILSRFAGAAEDLDEALIVNPYSIDATADVVRQALEMDLSERRARHRALKATVHRHDLAAWCRSYLAALERVRTSQDPPSLQLSKPIQYVLARLQNSTTKLGAPPPV